ncbi:acyl-CoA dehydrogenase [Corynebacterium poyangense]|uniref:Acyl-CoA dehydrogenase n=1 Tax=Corynebacterium poyangense TaxID=2684405 RepID=A0A7H0SR90_9CORY|nr:acyl-CoA dehydrogenase family protein [Corynebacterium poyangense]MBZ8176496.1 acyl-CoA dehydrogenase [Corynebacterium poyangense]QNQ91065.1 acyl-CoA dehydrogenase [Corynebacterium poyangense]
MSYDFYAPRDIYEEEHYAFRDMVRAFLDRHVVGHIDEWEDNHEVPQDVVEKAGAQGMIGIMSDEEYGGGGEKDFRYRMIAYEEFMRVGATSLNATISVHADIVLPYFEHLATPEQKQRWLPQLISGEWMASIAMTEPGAGSDLRGIKTTATKQGDHWVLNGNKIFITNGLRSHLVVVAARTPDDSHPKGGGYTLFVVEEGMEGFQRGRKLSKIGLHGQDTAELIFDNVKVPEENILGELHVGLHSLMSHLPLERLSLAAIAGAGARAALSWTTQYVQERKAFGQAIADFQNTQFQLADMVARLEATQAYIDAAVLKLNRDELGPVDAAKAKLIATEEHKSIVDRCLQFFGGYGYMLEYPIARAFADTRVSTIYGGTSEIMKLLIARDLLEKGK